MTMVSGKGERHASAKASKRKSLGPSKRDKHKRRLKQKVSIAEKEALNKVSVAKSKQKKEAVQVKSPSPSQQLEFFLDKFQSVNGVKLSTLELESITENCIVKAPVGHDQDASNLGEHLKFAFGSSWENKLCGTELDQGKIEAGSPAVIIFSTSALRSLDLLRELHPLTRKCQAAKLFSKHMKIENQVWIS
uniref:Uncharacterized protein n=1 Tax=Kalanchoe fedtschenkoi TaxID=63787 RepID=A0A7N0UIK5_KALFE